MPATNTSGRLSREHFLSVIDMTPLVSIDLIIQNPEGNILLGKRCNKPAQNYWFVPGGCIRKNEMLAQAIKRISTTELGFEINIEEVELIGVFDHIYEDNFANAENINTHYVALGYRYKSTHTLNINIDTQHNETDWFGIEELLNRDNVHANTKKYFNK